MQAKGGGETLYSTTELRDATESEAKDYGNLVDTARGELKGGLHLRRYKSRTAFVNIICHDPVRTSLVQCVMEMIARYLEIYKACIDRKHYALFEQ